MASRLDLPLKMSDSSVTAILVKIAMPCLPLAWVMFLMLLSVPDAGAGSPKPGPTSIAPAAESTATQGDPTQGLSNAVNDPTAPISLVQFRDVLAPRVPGADGAANLLEIQPIFPISATRAIPFTQLIKITPPIETTPGPDRTTGLGDVQFVGLLTVKQSWGRWGLGPTLVFPTATSDSLGQGKWQAGPAAAFMVTAIKNLQAGAVLQNPISFAGKSSRDSVNTLSITPTLTYNLAGGWFGGYSDFDWIFDWKNNGEATIPIGFQLGKVFAVDSVPLSLSLEAGYNVVRPSDSPEWLIGFELNWILMQRAKHH